ncbi:sodium- and chloride-dependent glycine transporter 2-like [Athalia rosae]|uniref:sodium- and chloride-dependent glycine transporter 2-like n=1 Tax=Athalia rosae TaxID=37344 RepID=UPI002033E847|nr:sodium- and chloride-dependent glycine transporter 2-like [Athalia rosae]
MASRSAEDNQRGQEAGEYLQQDTKNVGEPFEEKAHQQSQRGDEFVFQSRMEYLIIFLTLQSGNMNFIMTATNCAQYKGISFLILYISIHHLVIVPLQCQHLFLGYYSKFGYIKVWNIFPIGYGIGASMMAFSLYTCIISSTLIGQLLLQLCYLPFMPDNYWTDCSYESKNLPPCFELNSKHGTIDCNKTYYPGAAQYYRLSNLWRPEEKPDRIGPINEKWIALSAIVWIVVCILTNRDFKSFKGVFAKMMYFLTLVSFLVVILQWTIQGHSQKGSLLMLDFSGLFNYKIWVKALTHAILMSHICEGTIIQLGSYGPENTMPDTDAFLVGSLASTLQFLGVYYVYSSYGSMSDYYAVDISCFIWPYEIVIMALIPTQFSPFPMARIWILGVFLMLVVKGIMEMTIIFTATVNSFLEAFPSAKAYRSYLVSVVTVSCFSVSLIFTTKVGEIFTHHFLDFVATFVALLILAIMSSLILFSYSITRLCDDIQFLHKFEPTVVMKAVYYLTPLVTTYYTLSNLADILSLSDEISTLYDGLRNLQPFLIISCVALVTPLLLTSVILYGIHVRTHTVAMLFHPTRLWGCPDEELNKARRLFNPRRELRYKARKPCAHICLLDNKRMQMEIQKREAIRNRVKRYGFEAMNETA